MEYLCALETRLRRDHGIELSCSYGLIRPIEYHPDATAQMVPVEQYVYMVTKSIPPARFTIWGLVYEYSGVDEMRNDGRLVYKPLLGSH